MYNLNDYTVAQMVEVKQFQVRLTDVAQQTKQKKRSGKNSRFSK